jgi:hypothetical protein
VDRSTKPVFNPDAPRFKAPLVSSNNNNVDASTSTTEDVVSHVSENVSPSTSFVSKFSNDTNHGTMGTRSINYSNAQLHDNRDITDLTVRRDPVFNSLDASTSQELVVPVKDPNISATLSLDYDKNNSLFRIILHYKDRVKCRLAYL